MAKRVRTKIRRRKRGQSPATLLLLLLVWSIFLGWGLAIVLAASAEPIMLGATLKPEIVAQATAAQPGTVDLVPARYQLGKELYLENCASCHLPLPPEVLPTETWRQVLLEPQQHYGQKLEPMIGPALVVMWDYLRTFSRPKIGEEPTPYRVSESRYFRALHPRVDLPRPTKPSSCVECHPGAAQYDYRRLTPEWESSP